jgi:hypothetical protein
LKDHVSSGQQQQQLRSFRNVVSEKLSEKHIKVPHPYNINGSDYLVQT